MNDELRRDIQAYLVAHPTATVLDVCAEFDLTDEEAIRELQALRGAQWPGPIWPRFQSRDLDAHVADEFSEDRTTEARWLRETDETRREANWRPGQE